MTVNNMRGYKMNFSVFILIILFLLCIFDTSTYWNKTDLFLSDITIAVTVISVFTCCVKNKRINVNLTDAILIGWLLFETFLYWFGFGIFTKSAYIVFVQSILLYVVLRICFSVDNVDAKHIVTLILVCCMFESLYGVVQILTNSSRHSIFLVTGSFLNPGPYSAFLAMGVVIALCVKKTKTNYEICPDFLSWLSDIVLIISLPMLVITQSRASWIAVVSIVIWLYRKTLLKYKLYVILFIAIIAIFAYFVKRDSADGRLLIWSVSFMSICKHPLFGTGLGSFSNSFSKEMSLFSSENPTLSILNSAGVVDNAFNECITVGVEQGLLGLLAFIAVLILTFRHLMSMLPLLTGFFALILFSMFSYPFHIIPYRVILVVICAYAASHEAGKTIRYRNLLFSVVVLISICLFIRKEIKNKIDAVDSYNLISNIDGQYVLGDYRRLYQTLDDNSDFLFAYGKTLHEIGKYNDSNAVLYQGMQVSADPMFYVMTGNNFNKMNMPFDAEKYYMQAFKIMPNRIWPLYKLMLLYKAQNEYEKCQRMARKIVCFKEKVPSEATANIKGEARNILLE